MIATHGRSVYTLDDSAPIRGAGPVVAAAPLHVFTPAAGTRGVVDATVQYALAATADTVKIDVLDARGRLVRSFTGGARTDSARTAAATSPDTILAPSGCETRQGFRRRGGTDRPSGLAGLNRFTWDGRYPGATTFPCNIMWGGSAEAGPMAVPGEYQVRVTANGRTETRPLTLRIDPRLRGVTVADLQKQFDLAMQIRDRVSAADSAVIRIRRLRSQIAHRVADHPELAAPADSVAGRLLAIEEELYQVRNRSGQDPLNFPIKLNNRLAALQRSVETGDARPTDASYVVLRQLSAELDTVLRQLDRTVRTDVTRLNTLLASRGLMQVSGDMK